MQVAQEIFRQLGGGRFVSMTGASQLVGGANMLQFRIPLSRKGRINKIQIVLESNDTYTVKAYRIEQPGKRNSYQMTCHEVAVRSDVYCDALQEVFTELTGLYTHL